MKDIQSIIKNTFVNHNQLIDQLVKDNQVDEYPLNQWTATTLSYCICDQFTQYDDKAVSTAIRTDHNDDLNRLNDRIQQIWG